jgi:hypothetical protein
MISRMQHAIKLANLCWSKAAAVEPEFVEQYLALAEELLMHKSLVTGDEFRHFCASKGLRRPSTLHPNVWVSGVRALRSIGWIHPVTKVEPTRAHNHMPSVTQWVSMLYQANPNQYLLRL